MRKIINYGEKMTFINLVPVKDLELLQDNYHKYFGEIPVTQNFTNTISPKIDISEDEKNIYFEIEVPGIPKDKISILLENNSLKIKGDKRTHDVNDGKKLLLNEREFGSFSRSFKLAQDINSSSAKAEYENGVLKIVLEKAQKPAIKERQIQIK